MKKSQLRLLKPGSAEYVIAHADINEKRNRGPAMSYCGVSDPKQALLFALLSKKFDTEHQQNCAPNVILENDKFAGEHVALLSFRNSLVVAHGDNPQDVTFMAQQKGVKHPVIVFIPETEVLNP